MKIKLKKQKIIIIIIIRQNIPRAKEKKVHKISLRIHFVLANYSGHGACSGGVVDMPSNTPLEETDFQSFSKYQLQAASQLGMRFLISLPFLNAGILSGLNWC